MYMYTDLDHIEDAFDCLMVALIVVMHFNANKALNQKSETTIALKYCCFVPALHSPVPIL